MTTNGLETATKVACKSCQSANHRTLFGELAIHFPGLNGLHKPIIWVFPQLVVCLDCGATEFTIPEADLERLAKLSKEDSV